MRSTQIESLKPFLYGIALIILSVLVYIGIHIYMNRASANAGFMGANRLTQKTESSAYSQASTKDTYSFKDNRTKAPGALHEFSAKPMGLIAETDLTANTRSNQYGSATKKPNNSVDAVIVELKFADSCALDSTKGTSLPIWYRLESPTIRTSSLTELRDMVSQYRECEKSVFFMSENTKDEGSYSVELAQLRYNELKYFFTQNSVPSSALHYIE